MATVDVVSQELKMRPRAAVLSAAAAVLLFGSVIVQSVGARGKVDEVTVQLLVINKRSGLQILGAVVNGLGLIAVAGTLVFLFRASRARRPEMAQGTIIAAIAGAFLAALAGLISAFVLVSKAHDFATQGAQTYPQANDLLSTSAVTIPQYLGLLGSLGLAVGLVLVSLNAMRVGLLTRFLGYLGIAAAVASVFFVGAGGIGLLIQIGWLLAVAYLLGGRWPNGDPPAWQSGKAVPWPSSAELREQRQQAAAARGKPGARGGRQPASAARGGREPVPDEPVAAANTGTRATTPKRKRKRRK